VEAILAFIHGTGTSSLFFAVFIRLSILAKISFRTDQIGARRRPVFKVWWKARDSALSAKEEGKMKGLTMVGVILLVLGLLAFVVPIPHKEDHGVKIGDAKIGVQTEHSDRLPPLVAGVLVLAGVVSLAAGTRKSG
jgi:hypothetical protein